MVGAGMVLALMVLPNAVEVQDLEPRAYSDGLLGRSASANPGPFMSVDADFDALAVGSPVPWGGMF